MNQVNVIQLGSDGKPFFPGAEHAIGNVRVESPCKLVVLVPFVHDVQANPLMNIRNGQGETSEMQPTIIDNEGALVFELNLEIGDCGPLTFFLSSTSYQTSENLSTPESTIVVTPSTNRIDTYNMLTIMPRNLGLLERWLSALKLTAYSKYNSIHFTPIQKLGDSNSCFSIYDPLIVNPDIVGQGKTIDEAWKLLKDCVDEVEATYNILSTQDIVLNHLSKDSPFVIDNPQVGYNTENCPWLTGAFELDQSIARFSSEIVSGKYRDRGITEHVKSEEDIDKIANCFRDRVLQPFRLKEWLVQDSAHREVTFNNFRNTRGSVIATDILTVEHAVRKSIGIERYGLCISEENARHLDVKNEDEFRIKLEEALERIASEAGGMEDSIMGSLRGIIAWERLDQKRGPIRNDPGFTLLPNYFTTIKSGDGKEYDLAHNGWVMGWDATEDFAQAGSTVYLSRGLCVWSDCFKLNYGSSPESNPILWKTMKEYVERTATVFKGIRLDNCHSTPLVVAEYLLEAARKVRPDIAIYAELFTNDQTTDAKFEARLGLNGLIRELQHARDSHAVANIHTHYGAIPLTNTKHPPADLFIPSSILMRYHGKNIRSPRPTMAPALLFDQTHDNPAQMELFRGAHTLACAAIIAASPSGCGSTMGVDLLIPHHLSVVEERRQIESVDVEPESQDHSSEQVGDDATFPVHYHASTANSVQVAGTFNNWQPESAVKTEHSWTFDIPKSKFENGIVEFKFIVDGNWCTSDQHPISGGGYGNNVIDLNAKSVDDTSSVVGIHQSRRLLNQLHQRLAEEGFDNCEGRLIENTPLVVFTRLNQKTFEYYHFVIHTGFWDQPSWHGSIAFEVEGVYNDVEFLLQLHVNDDAKHNFYRDHSFIKGLDKKHHRSIIKRNKNELKTVLRPHKVDQGRTKINIKEHDFPVGSVVVFKTVIAEGKATSQLFDEKIANVCEIVTNTVSIHPQSLTDFSYLLYSCEPEELAISRGGRGLYQFDNVHVRYAGLATPLKLLDDSFHDAHFWDFNNRHAILKNMMAGDWLWNYHVDRLGVRESLFQIRDCIKECLNMVHHFDVPPSMKPIIFYKCLRMIFDSIKMHISNIGQMKDSVDPLATALMMSTIMFYASVDGSPLIEGTTHPSICAGFSHFAAGFMRAWGRDTFIALPGVLVATGRIEEAKAEVLGFARTMRHGNIPNLLDSGANSRFNARDAVWFFLRSVRIICQALGGKESVEEFLNSPVHLKWDEVFRTYDGMFPSDYSFESLTLKQLIHVVLSCHHEGIDYVEWNAGNKIDEQMKPNGFHVVHKFDENTGLILGGNPDNCGTWMDKMGSSSKANNKGVPSTPRDGAPVEIAAMLGATLEWVITDLIPNHFFPDTVSFKSSTSLKYADWYNTLIEKFDLLYYNDAKYYNDIYGSSNLGRCHDRQLRCNWVIAPCEIPKAFKESNKLLEAIRYSRKMLFGDTDQLGLKTLSPDDENYRPNYVNDDDSQDPSIAHGANYHQGPEWVWPLGFMIMAYQSVAKSNPSQASVIDHEARSILCNHRKFVQKDITMSLPELTQRNGAECVYSCWAQAWSVGCCLEAMANGSYSSAIKTSIKAPNTEPVKMDIQPEKKTTDKKPETEAKPAPSVDVIDRIDTGTPSVIAVTANMVEITSKEDENDDPEPEEKVTPVAPPTGIETPIAATGPQAKPKQGTTPPLNKRNRNRK